MGGITPNAVAVEARGEVRLAKDSRSKTARETSVCNLELGLADILDVDNSPLIFNNVCILKYR